MLQVKTPEEVLRLIHDKFRPVSELAESVPLTAAVGRTLSEDIIAEEYVPDFNRSTVDGYAVRAADTFGCSDAIPAILSLQGEIRMGEDAGFALLRENCAYVPTGGALPEGADCAVMLEYTEDYGDGTIGILKPGAPGMNVIFRGDDVYPGKIVLQAGRVLSAQDIGALAAIGRTVVPVQRKLKIGVISTGDELVPPGQKPLPGQVRDVNTALLSALLTEQGAEVHSYGIIVDDEVLLRETVTRAVQECDAVLLSGGSSVGVKDASCRIIESLGELLLSARHCPQARQAHHYGPGRQQASRRSSWASGCGLRGRPAFYGSVAGPARGTGASPLVRDGRAQRERRRQPRPRPGESLSAASTGRTRPGPAHPFQVRADHTARRGGRLLLH